MPINIAIIEDNRDYLMGITFILRASAAFKVVGEYGNAEDFFDELEETKPDIVLMDIGLPGISGIEATKRLKQQKPRMQIVILSMYQDDDNVFKAICAGAIGYITKPVKPELLLSSVEEAYNGGTPMSPHIARNVLEMFKRNLPPPKVDYDLTKREIEVLEYIVLGDDYKLIADKMFLSVYTIRAHVRNIYDKLHVHTRSQAVSKTLNEHLLPISF